MSKQEPFPKAVLEQIFANKTARVLDHLLTMKPFDYSFDELASILNIENIQLNKILNHLENYGLIENSKSFKWRIADNNKTKALNKCLFAIACENMEEIVKEQQTKKGKRS